MHPWCNIDTHAPYAQAAGMNGKIGSELEKLGRAAAEQVAGHDAVEQVEVEHGEDAYERPVYHFDFLINQPRARQRAGLIRTRLVQKLRDDLVERGDGHLPVIQIFSREDWNKRKNARPL
jgi:hypothetical protein